MDHLQYSIVLFEVDIELDIRRLVSFGLSHLLIALEGLQDLKCALDDTLDGSILVDLFGEVFILYNFLLWLAGFL